MRTDEHCSWNGICRWSGSVFADLGNRVVCVA